MLQSAKTSWRFGFPASLLYPLVMIVLLMAGLMIRLYDLTDLPLDFHPTRQLLSAHKSRGMYYQTLATLPEWQRSFAIQQWKIRAEVEPEILERLVALTYRYTGEYLWIARIYSSVFWIIGGYFLFLLVRDMVSSEGAVTAIAIYLFIPYSVMASRSFQPDPLMVMLVIIFWWAVWKYAQAITVRENPAPSGSKDNSQDTNLRTKQIAGWKWAILAGVIGGLAILIKLVAVFFIIGGSLGALLGREKTIRTFRRPQVWTMILLGILPGLIYIIYGVWVKSYLAQQFGGRFFPALFLKPSYYLGWAGMLDIVAGGWLLMLGLIGLYLFRRKTNQRFVLGLWIGYGVFGLYFNYHISTHDYYSLPLIPMVALSAAPLGELLLKSLAGVTATSRARLIACSILLFGLFLVNWNLRKDLKLVDYRPQAVMWSEIGNLLGKDARVVGLTQDYGMRLAYWGWLAPAPWPYTGDLNYHAARGARIQFDEEFDLLTRKKDYFLVTDFEELDRQPLLKEKLSSRYAFIQGDGYVVYYLKTGTQ